MADTPVTPTVPTPPVASAPVQPVVPTAPNAVMMPVVHAQLNELAALPPGPAAQSKVADILALFASMLGNPDVAAVLPTSWKMYIAGIIAILGLLGGSFVTGRVTAPTAPAAPIVADKPVDKPVPVVVNVQPSVPPVTPEAKTPGTTPITPPTAKAGCQCGCVTSGKCVCKDCDHPMLTAPVTPPIVPPAKTMKLVLYTTPALDVSKLLADPSLKALPFAGEIDPKVYAVGSTTNWQGKQLTLPVAMLYNAGGTLVDVQPFATAADLAAMVGRQK